MSSSSSPKPCKETDEHAKQQTLPHLPSLSSLLHSSDSRSLPLPRRELMNVLPVGETSTSSVTLPPIKSSILSSATTVNDTPVKRSNSYAGTSSPQMCNSDKESVKSEPKSAPQAQENATPLDRNACKTDKISKDSNSSVLELTPKHKTSAVARRNAADNNEDASVHAASQHTAQGSFYLPNSTMYYPYPITASPLSSHQQRQNSFIYQSAHPMTFISPPPLQMSSPVAMRVAPHPPQPGMVPISMRMPMRISPNTTSQFSVMQSQQTSTPNTSRAGSVVFGMPPEVATSPSMRKRKRPTPVKKYAFISHSPATFLSSEPSIDNARLARRKRRRTSPAELEILKAEFKKGTTPNRARRKEIAARVDMTEKAVQIWFQNRRQALRKHKVVKKMVVEVPQREELDKCVLAGQTTAHDSVTDDGNATVTDSAQTSPATSPSRADRTFISLTNSSSANISSMTTSPRNSTILPASPMPVAKSTPTSHEGTMLPPKGVFVTPSKIGKSIPATSSSFNNNSFNSLGRVRSPKVAHDGSTPLTFRFRTTDFFMMNPSKSMKRKQKPTMRVNPHISGKAKTSVLQDKTNITNNTNKTKGTTGKIHKSSLRRAKKPGLQTAGHPNQNAENTPRN
ncbi:hypothetical protein HII13_000950 [Brettanomyces bruxellensis]|nr:hypothetical protein HII13_000950 [Brettanomyces bruxellensis]